MGGPVFTTCGILIALLAGFEGVWELDHANLAEHWDASWDIHAGNIISTS